MVKVLNQAILVDGRPLYVTSVSQKHSEYLQLSFSSACLLVLMSWHKRVTGVSTGSTSLIMLTLHTGGGQLLRSHGFAVKLVFGDFWARLTQLQLFQEVLVCVILWCVLTKNTITQCELWPQQYQDSGALRHW